MNDTDILTEEHASFRVDNLLDTADWLGKGDDEINVPEEYIIKSRTIKEIDITGELFSRECQGKAYYAFLGEEKDKYVQEIRIYIDDISFEECEKELEKLYGEPAYTVENPYVESLGGVVTVTVYETDKMKVKIQNASKYNFCELSFILNEKDSD